MKFLKIYHTSGDVRYVRLEQVQDIYTYSGPFSDCKSKIEMISEAGEVTTYLSKHKPEDAIQQVVEV